MSDDYEVGYGKPPKHTRFKKGQSGNSRGRPKGTRNLKTDLKEELSERVRIREGGCTRKVSKQRAVLMAMMAKALKGDTRAAAYLLALVDRQFGSEEDAHAETPLSADERAFLDFAVERELERRRATAVESENGDNGTDRNDKRDGG